MKLVSMLLPLMLILVYLQYFKRSSCLLVDLVLKFWFWVSNIVSVQLGKGQIGMSYITHEKKKKSSLNPQDFLIKLCIPPLYWKQYPGCSALINTVTVIFLPYFPQSFLKVNAIWWKEKCFRNTNIYCSKLEQSVKKFSW